MIKIMPRFLIIFVLIVLMLVGKFSIFNVGENIASWYSLTADTNKLNSDVSIYQASIADKESQFVQERGDSDYQVIDRSVIAIKKLPGVTATSSKLNVITSQGVLDTTDPTKATGVTLNLKVKDIVETTRKLDGLNLFIEQMSIDPVGKTIRLTIRTGEIAL